jgi:hypothetical protein
MFTWISKASPLALIFWLAACQMTPGLSIDQDRARTLSVLGGAVKVAAPPGYCVDRKLARQQSDGAVVLIGRCTATSAQFPVVITVTIGAAASAGAIADGGATLAAFFETTAGRAALSQSGRAETVTIVQSGALGGVYTLQIQEAEVGDYWRAVFGLSGRLVTLSIQAPLGQSLDQSSGQRLLNATIAALRRANAV